MPNWGFFTNGRFSEKLPILPNWSKIPNTVRTSETVARKNRPLKDSDSICHSHAVLKSSGLLENFSSLGVKGLCCIKKRQAKKYAYIHEKADCQPILMHRWCSVLIQSATVQWQKRLAGSLWDPANRWRETWFGLENRKKSSQMINDYLYLLFTLLFTLWTSLLITTGKWYIRIIRKDIFSILWDGYVSVIT